MRVQRGMTSLNFEDPIKFRSRSHFDTPKKNRVGASGGVENPSTHLSPFRPGLGNDKVRGGCPGLGKSFKLFTRMVHVNFGHRIQRNILKVPGLQVIFGYSLEMRTIIWPYIQCDVVLRNVTFLLRRGAALGF